MLIGGVILLAYAFCLPKALFDDPVSTVLKDRNGVLLGAHIAKDGQWRFPEIGIVPNRYKEALLEFEDKRFDGHWGVDPLAIARATRQNIANKSIVSGGSTITMQVIRLSRKGKSRNVYEKLIEMVLATRLELRHSKARILALHASHAPFGGNVVGLNAASWRYFGRSPNDLSWAEAATLAVLPNSPSLIHPGKNRDALLAKRNRLLHRLLESNKLDTLNYMLALDEELPEKPLALPRLAPHLLSKSGTVNPSAVSTLDAGMQQTANSIAERHHRILRQNQIHNAAILVLNTKTGEVLSYVGNTRKSGKVKHGNDVDVVRAPRSTGSIIKPLLYAKAFDGGMLIPSQLMEDVPTQMLNYRPQNFNEKYDGVVSAERALIRSLNVPVVRLLSDYGLERFHADLKKMGISTLHQPAHHYGLPLVLGGAEVTLHDITGIYASMGRTLWDFNNNSGSYDKNTWRNPTLTQQELEVSYDLKDPVHLSAGSIWHTFQAMRQVERPGSEGGWQTFHSSRPIAWKTGTSFGFRDAWAIGVTPEYTVGVWVGNADGEGRPDLIGVRAAAPILFDMFKALPPTTWFQTPWDDLRPKQVCKQSGFKAGRNCTDIHEVDLCHGAVNVKVCPYHKVITTDTSHSFQYYVDCAKGKNLIQQSWFILPPLAERYYVKRHPDYRQAPPLAAECDGTSGQNNMALIYPDRTKVIYIPKEFGGLKGKTIFRATHRDPSKEIHWHVDNTYVGSTQTFHELELAPGPGDHVLTIVDEAGEKISQAFRIADETSGT